MSENYTYSMPWKVTFWLFWLMGLSGCLLFGFLAIITVSGAPLIGLVNIAAAFVQGVVLITTAGHLSQKKKPASELLLWIALASIGIPLLAMGGCLGIDNLGGGIRIGG